MWGVAAGLGAGCGARVVGVGFRLRAEVAVRWLGFELEAAVAHRARRDHGSHRHGDLCHCLADWRQRLQPYRHGTIIIITLSV